MLDFENELFDRTKAHVLASVPDAVVKGELEDRPASLPFLSMVQMANTTYQRTATFERNTNHVAVMLELQGFTNGEGKKARCKAMMDAALDFLCGDGEAGGLGMVLVYNQPVANAADPNIHRRVARVEGVIGENKLIYWR